MSGSGYGVAGGGGAAGGGVAGQNDRLFTNGIPGIPGLSGSGHRNEGVTNWLIFSVNIKLNDPVLN